MTILAERPAASAGAVDLAALAAEVEAFITHPVPYELGDGRAQLRGDARTSALAHLLGDLAELLEHDQVNAETVTTAIRTALHAGAALQRTRLAAG